MFGSKILEVAIGLIFVFMIYSLFASAIQEMISSVLVLRARMLRKTIHKMLSDHESHFQQTKGRNYFYRIFIGLKNLLFFFLHPFIPKLKEEHSLSSMFYEQPSIKYLAVSNWYKRPSYIKPETFAKTIYDILLNNGIGYTEKDKIDNILETNKLNFEGDELAIDGETLSHIKSLWRDAKQDTESFKKLLVVWYDETMERLKGYYKRNMRIYLFVIGYLIAIIFNVDIVSLSNKLSRDDKVRNDLVQLASSYMQTAAKDSTFTKRKSDSTNRKKDSMAVEIRSLYRMMKRDLDEPNSLLAIGWNVPKNFERDRKADSLSKLSIYNPRYRKRAVNVGDECLTKIYTIKNAKTPIVQNQKLTFWDKLWYFWLMATNPRSLLGFLITAIGISMGAPFWFEILQKAIKLKDTLKPKETETKST